MIRDTIGHLILGSASELSLSLVRIAPGGSDRSDVTLMPVDAALLEIQRVYIIERSNRVNGDERDSHKV